MLRSSAAMAAADAGGGATEVSDGEEGSFGLEAAAGGGAGRFVVSLDTCWVRSDIVFRRLSLRCFSESRVCLSWAICCRNRELVCAVPTLKASNTCLKAVTCGSSGFGGGASMRETTSAKSALCSPRIRELHSAPTNDAKRQQSDRTAGFG